MARIKLYKDFPKKKYDIIYADPPWTYRDKALNRGGCRYRMLSIKNIIKLPVVKIASDNCLLFLWVTMPMLFDVESDIATSNIQLIIKNWGFEYKTVGFVWVKMNKVRSDTLFWGMGRWTRSNIELCLLATRGRPKRVDAGVHSVIMSKIEKHSRKPGEARKRIVELVGNISRIELFARERVVGWDSWGNEL